MATEILRSCGYAGCTLSAAYGEQYCTRHTNLVREAGINEMPTDQIDPYIRESINEIMPMLEKGEAEEYKKEIVADIGRQADLFKVINWDNEVIQFAYYIKDHPEQFDIDQILNLQKAFVLQQPHRPSGVECKACSSTNTREDHYVKCERCGVTYEGLPAYQINEMFDSLTKNIERTEKIKAYRGELANRVKEYARLFARELYATALDFIPEDSEIKNTFTQAVQAQAKKLVAMVQKAVYGSAGAKSQSEKK